MAYTLEDTFAEKAAIMGEQAFLNECEYELSSSELVELINILNREYDMIADEIPYSDIYMGLDYEKRLLIGNSSLERALTPSDQWDVSEWSQYDDKRLKIITRLINGIRKIMRCRKRCAISAKNDQERTKNRTPLIGSIPTHGDINIGMLTLEELDRYISHLSGNKSKSTLMGQIQRREAGIRKKMDEIKELKMALRSANKSVDASGEVDIPKFKKRERELVQEIMEVNIKIVIVAYCSHKGVLPISPETIDDIIRELANTNTQYEQYLRRASNEYRMIAYVKELMSKCGEIVRKKDGKAERTKVREVQFNTHLLHERTKELQAELKRMETEQKECQTTISTHEKKRGRALAAIYSSGEMKQKHERLEILLYELDKEIQLLYSFYNVLYNDYNSYTRWEELHVHDSRISVNWNVNLNWCI